MLNATSRRASRPVKLGRQIDTALERFNETQETRQLHPTKGWRRISVKRSRATILMADILSGRRVTLAIMREFMRSGLMK